MAEYSEFSLVYRGGVADRGMMDLYDASQSYFGFARVLAVLGQYYSTKEIVHQAPSADIEIFIGIPEDGSFRQNVYAAVVGAVVAAPLTTFIDYTVRSWLPPPDSDMKKVIELLQEQNSLLKKKIDVKQQANEIAAVKNFVQDNKTEMDVIRSITSNSFRQIFRPVGKSVDNVGLLAGPQRQPIGAVDETALNLIEADVPDDDTALVQGVVNSFSRNSKTGVIFSRRLGRGFRFEYVGADSLPRGDLFSWSQYYGRQIQIEGRFIRFFDQTVKKFEVYRVEKYEAEESD